MHIFNLVSDLNWYYQVASVVGVYIVTLVAAIGVVWWVAGEDSASIVMDTYGIPLLAVCRLVHKLGLLVLWPIRYRRHRLVLEDVFGYRQPNQEMIDSSLSAIAKRWQQTGDSAELKLFHQSRNAAQFFGFKAKSISDYAYENQSSFRWVA